MSGLEIFNIVMICIAVTGLILIFALLFLGNFFAHRYATKKANQEMRKWVEEQREQGLVPDGYEWEDVEP